MLKVYNSPEEIILTMLIPYCKVIKKEFINFLNEIKNLLYFAKIILLGYLWYNILDFHSKFCLTALGAIVTGKKGLNLGLQSGAMELSGKGRAMAADDSYYLVAKISVSNCEHSQRSGIPKVPL
jgi:hypothetical protein